MPKINQEEYEVLKGLEDIWKWIARDELLNEVVIFNEEPMRHHQLNYWTTVLYTQQKEKISSHLFQFVQWEDSEPWSVQELIEEYESSLIKSTPWTPDPLDFESEGTEVKKDKKGLVKYLEKEISNFKSGQMIYDYLTFILKQVNQLDEPEEITYEDALEVIAENIDTDEFSIGLYLEALSNNEKYEFLTEKWIERNTSPVDDEGRLYIWKRDLQNAIVPTLSEMKKVQLSQKTADEINRYKELGYSLKDLLVIAGSKQAQEKLARAWLDGFTVEAEQKYFAKIKGHENISSDDKYWNYCITDESLDIGDNNVHADVLAKYVLNATKDEWENLGINDDNADFVKVEELEE